MVLISSGASASIAAGNHDWCQAWGFLCELLEYGNTTALLLSEDLAGQGTPLPGKQGCKCLRCGLSSLSSSISSSCITFLLSCSDLRQVCCSTRSGTTSPSQTLTKGGELPAEGETTERRQELLAQGILPYRLDPLDHRSHLVHRDDVQTLYQSDQGMTVEQARQNLDLSREKMKSLIDKKILQTRRSLLRRNRLLVVQESYEPLLQERQARPKKNR